MTLQYTSLIDVYPDWNKPIITPRSKSLDDNNNSAKLISELNLRSKSQDDTKELNISIQENNPRYKKQDDTSSFTELISEKDLPPPPYTLEDKKLSFFKKCKNFFANLFKKS